MKIGELAAISGLSAHTIRYYERIGLMPAASRNGSGHRSYDPQTLVWIEFLGRLKTTGMPLRDMLRYAKLRSLGATSEAEGKLCWRRIVMRCEPMSMTSWSALMCSMPKSPAMAITPAQRQRNDPTY